MTREEEIRLIRELLGLEQEGSAFLDEATACSPVTRYACPDRFVAERERIFRALPVVAAHASELGGPNAFLTREIAGLPVLLVRDGDGASRAFLNVCRHRGARLEREASGCKRVFTCPYHAWSWSNRGDLRAIPHRDQGFPDVDRADRPLRALPAHEAHGFVWIVADPDAEAPNFSAWFDALGPDLDWIGLRDARIAAEETLEIAANWKVLVEGGVEAYHFRVAHKDTIGPYFPDNLSSYALFGPHMRSVLPRVTFTDLRERPETEWSIRREANLLYTVFPTSQFLVQQDHTVWVRLEPLAADRTEVRIATLAPREEAQTEERARHWARNQAITKATLIEDFEIGAEIQQGFASRANDHHLFGRFEGALDRFNRTVEASLAGSPAE